MCGINGFISNNHNIKTKNIIESMNRCIIHRGPDDSGTFVDISTNTSNISRTSGISKQPPLSRAS